MSPAEALLAEATTGLGVVDYARLVELLTARTASTELWGEVGRALARRGEGEAWERYLGMHYPMEAPTVLERRQLEN